MISSGIILLATIAFQLTPVIVVAKNYEQSHGDILNWEFGEYSYAVRAGGEGQVKVTFNDCAGLCSEDRSDMLDIQTSAEFAKLNLMLNYREPAAIYWTAGARDPNLATFHWRTTGDEIPAAFWAHGQPQDLTGSRICVELKRDHHSNSHPFKLSVLPTCTGPRECICKKKISGPPPEPIQNWKCGSVGMFPDPNVCNAFHQCVSDGRGGFIDYKTMCGPGTVFCSGPMICGWERDCPCSGQIIE